VEGKRSKTADFAAAAALCTRSPGISRADSDILQQCEHTAYGPQRQCILQFQRRFSFIMSFRLEEPGRKRKVGKETTACPSRHSASSRNSCHKTLMSKLGSKDGYVNLITNTLTVTLGSWHKLQLSGQKLFPLHSRTILCLIITCLGSSFLIVS